MLAEASGVEVLGSSVMTEIRVLREHHEGHPVQARVRESQSRCLAVLAQGWERGRERHLTGASYAKDHKFNF